MFIKQQSCTVPHTWFQKYFDHCADNTELTVFQYHLFSLNYYGLYFMHSKSILPKGELRWRSPALSPEKRQSWFRQEAGLEGYTGNDPAASHLRRPSCPRAERDAQTWELSSRPSSGWWLHSWHWISEQRHMGQWEGFNNSVISSQTLLSGDPWRSEDLSVSYVWAPETFRKQESVLLFMTLPSFRIERKFLTIK